MIEKRERTPTSLYAPPDATPDYLQMGNCSSCGVWLHGKLRDNVLEQHVRVVHSLSQRGRHEGRPA